MSLQPYIGVGAGWAFIEEADSSFALSGTLGARFPITDNAYLGARYRLQWISGPTTDDGVDLDSFLNHGVSAMIGVTF